MQGITFAKTNILCTDLREEKTGVRENLVEFQERKEKLLHTTDGRDLKVYRELLQKYKAEAEVILITVHRKVQQQELLH